MWLCMTMTDGRIGLSRESDVLSLAVMPGHEFVKVRFSEGSIDDVSILSAHRDIMSALNEMHRRKAEAEKDEARQDESDAGPPDLSSQRYTEVLISKKCPHCLAHIGDNIFDCPECLRPLDAPAALPIDLQLAEDTHHDCPICQSSVSLDLDVCPFCHESFVDPKDEQDALAAESEARMAGAARVAAELGECPTHKQPWATCDCTATPAQQLGTDKASIAILGDPMASAKELLAAKRLRETPKA